MAMRTWTVLVVLSALSACSNPLRSRQQGAPTPQDVLAYVTRGLSGADRFSLLRLDRDEAGVVAWSLAWDGIPIVGMAAGSRSELHWKIEAPRSLRAPETLRKADLISARVAAEQAGVADAFAQGHVDERLEYFAMQKDIPLKPGATNEIDFELVIDRYAPMFEVKDERGEGALVDAYSGAVFMKLTNWVN